MNLFRWIGPTGQLFGPRGEYVRLQKEAVYIKFQLVAEKSSLMRVIGNFNTLTSSELGLGIILK